MNKEERSEYNRKYYKKSQEGIHENLLHYKIVLKLGSNFYILEGNNLNSLYGKENIALEEDFAYIVKGQDRYLKNNDILYTIVIVPVNAYYNRFNADCSLSKYKKQIKQALELIFPK